MSSNLAANLRRADFLFNPLEVEILGEKASSLGHRGRQVEQAMAALRSFDARPDGKPDARHELVRAAAGEVWAYFVQRELCGMRDHREVIAFYGIPPEVLVRLGAVEKR